MSTTTLTVNETVDTLSVIADDRMITIEDPAKTLVVVEDNKTITISEIRETLVVEEGAKNLESDSPKEVLTAIDTGPQGAQGDAATISVGTVTTVANGAGSSVTNSGTSEVAVLNFQLEAGPATNSTVVHDQATSSATWTINHNQGRYPSVDVTDSAGTHVIGDISYPTVDQIVVSFDNPFAGKAIIV
jgi:hypothetical protein